MHSSLDPDSTSTQNKPASPPSRLNPFSTIAALKDRFVRLSRLFQLAIIALLLIALGMSLSLLRGPVVEVDRVKRQDLLQTVVTTGRVSSLAKVELASQALGNAAAVLVDVGATVRAGQALIRLRDVEAQAALAQAKGFLSEAELRMKQLREVDEPVSRAALRQAEANRLNALSTYDRYQSLHKKGFVSRSELDEARRAFDVAENQQEQERVKLNSLAQAGSEYQQAEARLAQARASLSMAEERLRQTVITAPGDGRVINRSVEAGDIVQPGKTLLVMTRAGRIQIIAQIDEKNLGLLQEGQEALGSADAYPDKNFSARLVTLVPAVDPLRGTVDVRFDVAAPPAYLVPDMTVSLEVKAARKQNILTLPSRDVREGVTGPWVMVVRSNRTARQNVTLGGKTDGFVEILSGVGEDEAVIPAQDTRTREGRRVRPRSGGADAH